MPPPRRPDPEPLESDEVRVVIVGTVLWFLGLALALAFHGPLADRGHGDWVWTLLAGSLLGLVGLRYVVRRRAALRRDAADSPAQTGPGVRE
jgi:O-antigen/teichoic acid export membrane protein